MILARFSKGGGKDRNRSLPLLNLHRAADTVAPFNVTSSLPSPRHASPSAVPASPTPPYSRHIPQEHTFPQITHAGSPQAASGSDFAGAAPSAAMGFSCGAAGKSLALYAGGLPAWALPNDGLAGLAPVAPSISCALATYSPE